jgi:hypothetical protein
MFESIAAALIAPDLTHWHSLTADTWERTDGMYVQQNDNGKWFAADGNGNPVTTAYGMTAHEVMDRVNGSYPLR